MNTQQLLEQAADLHRAGRLADAERTYRQVLSADPNNADALHLLGVLNGQLGRSDAAAQFICRAIAINPNVAVFHGNLGLTLDRMGRIEEALQSFEKALALGSTEPNILNNYADALRKKGSLELSIATFRSLLTKHPNFPDALNNLGIALVATNEVDEAIAQYRLAIRANPQFAEAHNNLGNALMKRRDFETAVTEFQRALVIRPEYPDAMMNMGIALKDLNRHDDAMNLFQRALRLRPNFFEAHLNLGQALCDIHDLDGAIAEFKKAIYLRPDDPAPHFHLSGALLLKGDFAAGWKEYEWRLLKTDFPFANLHFSQPRWSGEDLNGKRIYLHAEQGAGDLIQYCRLISLLTGRGAQTILGSPPHMLRLLRTLEGVSQITTEVPGKSEADYHCWLLSLPLMLGMRLENIPTQVPYLRADSALADQWRTRLADLPAGKKIGLCWAGNPQHSNDHNRSISISQFAQVAEIPNVNLISVQKGNTGGEPRPAGLKLADYTGEISDYADTAALIANLDLVISADTSVAHLAGALGKPTWTLLPFHPDLRWLLNRSDSPWYPTMRLFRQPKPRDWQSVIHAVGEGIRQLS
jgi:tetratricopeptide (TPR) repeat protein